MALDLEKVALPDSSIADGYAYWNAGAISLPGSVTIPNQEEDRKYLPFVPLVQCRKCMTWLRMRLRRIL